MKHEGWTEADLTPLQADRLDRYEILLRERAARGMIGVADLADLRNRHLLDSLRGAPHIGPDVRSACDLGSGAGLPGIPLAIVRPHVRFVLAEPRQARAAFLELVLERLQLVNAEVFARPAGELGERFDVCFARGFGGPGASWEEAERLLAPGGSLLYWAGASFRPELAPSEVRLRLEGEVTLESGGPIVIMTRQ